MSTHGQKKTHKSLFKTHDNILRSLYANQLLRAIHTFADTENTQVRYISLKWNNDTGVAISRSVSTEDTGACDQQSTSVETEASWK